MTPQPKTYLEASGEAGLTGLLVRWNEGDTSVFEKIFPLVYSELHSIAGRLMRRESRDHLMQATALVNEAYLRLAGNEQNNPQNIADNRCHFFAIAAKVMRHILVDHARREHAQKRGGVWARVTLDEHLADRTPQSDHILALDAALTKLAAMDERKARIIELRYFAALEVKEIASLCGVSVETVMRDLRLAKVWLKREFERS